MEKTEDIVKAYILKEFLPGEKPETLTESTPLLTGGILDSIQTIKLVAFLEKNFKIQLEPTDIDEDRLNTILDITKLVGSKVDG